MNISRRKPLIGVAIGLVLLISWYKVIWSGQTKAISLADSKTVAAVGAMKKVKGDADRLSTLKTDPSRLRLDAKLAKAAPDQPELPDYMRWIRATADAHHLAMPTVSHSSPAAVGADAGQQADGAYVQIALTMQASGQYNDLLDFVHTLETADRLIIVDSLTLSKGGTAVASAPTDVAAEGATAEANQTMSLSLTARMFARHGIAQTSQAPTGAVPAVGGATPTVSTTAAGVVSS